MNKTQLRKLRATYDKYLTRSGKEFDKGIFRKFKKDFQEARRKGLTI